MQYVYVYVPMCLCVCVCCVYACTYMCIYVMVAYASTCACDLECFGMHGCSVHVPWQCIVPTCVCGVVEGSVL